MMKDTKLHRFYSTFSVEEAKEWLTFVQSPYFNTNPNVVKMATILRSYHPDMEHKGLAKERVYRRIFGKEAYQDIKMRKLMSACVKLIERYWVSKEVESNDLIYRRQLTHGYRHRDLFVDYQKEMNGLIKDHEQRAKINPESFYDLYQLNWDLTADRQFLKGMDLQRQLLQVSDNMHRYSQYLHLLLYLTLYDTSRITGLTVPNYLSNRPKFEKIISQTPSESILLIIENIITKEKIDFDLFDAATQFLKEQYSNIEEDICYYSYRLLMNYLISQRRKGASINKRYIPLMKEALERDVYIYRGKISVAIFTNLTIELAENDLFDEADDFVQSSRPFLAGSQIQEIINVANGHILFHRKEYSNAFELVSSFYFSGKLDYEIVRRTIQLRSALSSSKVTPENTYSLCDSFEKFIRHKLISNDKRQTLMQFISLIRRIQNLRVGVKDYQKSKSNIIQDIHKMTFNPKIIAWLISEVK